MHIPFCGGSGTHQNYRPQSISHPGSAPGASPTSMQRFQTSAIVYLPARGPEIRWCSFVTLHLVWTISFANHRGTVCLEPFIPVLLVEIPCFQHFLPRAVFRHRIRIPFHATAIEGCNNDQDQASNSSYHSAGNSSSMIIGLRWRCSRWR